MLRKFFRRRAVIVTGVAVIAIGAMLGGAAAAFQWRFDPQPHEIAMPAPKDRAEGMRQDLAALGQLVDLDRSFSHDARLQFEVERQRLMEAAETLTPQAFEMQVSRLVAIAGNGHTTVGRKLRRINRVPMRMMWFDEGLYVVRTSEAHGDLLGARVVSINGSTPEELLAGLAPYVSGPAEQARVMSPLLMESPGALSGVWPEMDTERATYVLQTPAGEDLTVTLEGIAPNPAVTPVFAPRDLAPDPIEGEAGSWRGVLAGKTRLPLVLREPDASLYVKNLGKDGLYIHLASVMGDERGDLSTQLAALVDAIEPASLRYAILDLRFDGGGNYMNTLRFTRELPRRIAPDGKLFLLTDNATFSAAIVTLARAKYFGGARAVIVGERIGDRERFWAESGAPLKLPNSKIMVFFATGYHDWHDGCGWKDLTRCFWLNLPFDVPAGNLSPAKVVAWRFEDYQRGVDTVMEEVLKMAAPHQP